MSDDYLGWNDEWDEWDEEGGGDFPPSSDASSALLRELMETYGYSDVGDILIDFEKADPSQLRGNRFSSLLEAVLWMHDIGVLGFSHVVYLGEDEYGAEIPDNTP